MPEIEQLRAALQEGDVSHLINEEAEEPMLASSLVTLPTYIKRSSQLPAEVAAMLGHNQETYRYIQENFPDSLTVARSVSDYRLQDDLNVEAKEGKVETTGVKLKRRVSSMMRTKSILKKKEVLAAAEDCCFDDITVSKAPGFFHSISNHQWRSYASIFKFLYIVKFLAESQAHKVVIVIVNVNIIVNIPG